MEQDLRSYSPLTFAFLGDGVYGLYVRTALVNSGNTQARKLHERTSRIVSATAQARALDAISDVLTDEEADIVNRGSNAHTAHQAKNASSFDYHRATGLETLFGYLYLKGDTDRIEELIELCIDSVTGSGRQDGR
ncbi:MAG: ribonuclease III [Lachnospiraceae bacterium]|nr:ribonuclease III [Lachnospiraceae bacterium]